MKWRWPPWRRAEVTGEAIEQLTKLEQRDTEVDRLGTELRQRQQENHFSSMVARAIRRGAQEGS